VSTVVSPDRDQESHQENQSAETPRNIFEDPAIAAAAQNDPFVRFVAKSWRAILAALGAIALVIIAVNRFSDTQQARKAALTRDVRDIQSSYRELVLKQGELETSRSSGASAEGQADAIKALEATVQQLRERTNLKLTALESSGAFPEVARLYRGLVEAQTGDLDKVKSLLESARWDQVPDDSAERLVAELTVFALAKSLIDSPAHRALAQQALIGLAEKGNFAAPQSVLALSTLARTDEERTKVKQLVDGVAKRLPSQRKYLSTLVDE
jgi:hypothetical protein